MVSTRMNELSEEMKRMIGEEAAEEIVKRMSELDAERISTLHNHLKTIAEYTLTACRPTTVM